MKRNLFVFLAGILLLLAGIATVWAGRSREEKKLENEASVVNNMGKEPQGQKAVVQRLEKQFNVTEAQITSLRNQKLGYGEIAIVFSLAQKTGGITQDNVNKIMTMRQGPPVMGWGQIAKSLNLKLGKVVSDVEKVNKGAGKEMRTAERERAEKMKNERNEGRMREDKMERSGNRERTSHMDRPAHGK